MPTTKLVDVSAVLYTFTSKKTATDLIQISKGPTARRLIATQIPNEGASTVAGAALAFVADLISSYATIPTSLAFAAHLAASAGLRKGGPGRARIDLRRPKQTSDKRKRYSNRFHHKCPSKRGLHIIRKLSNLWIDSFGQNVAYLPYSVLRKSNPNSDE